MEGIRGGIPRHTILDDPESKLLEGWVEAYTPASWMNYGGIGVCEWTRER